MFVYTCAQRKLTQSVGSRSGGEAIYTELFWWQFAGNEGLRADPTLTYSAGLVSSELFRQRY